MYQLISRHWKEISENSVILHKHGCTVSLAASLTSDCVRRSHGPQCEGPLERSQCVVYVYQNGGSRGAKTSTTHQATLPEQSAQCFLLLQKFWFSHEIMFGIWQHREMAMHQNRNTQQALLKVLYRKQWTLNTNSRTTVQNLTCTLYHRLIISLFGLETIKTKIISLVWGVEINKLFNNTQTTCAAGNEKAEVTLEYNILELVLPFSLFQVKCC